MEVKPASKHNIDRIVDVHNSAFPGFFLTELGDSFLKLYYSSVLKSKSGILLECIEDGKEKDLGSNIVRIKMLDIFKTL